MEPPGFPTMDHWLANRANLNKKENASTTSLAEWTVLDQDEAKSTNIESGSIIIGYEQGTSRPIRLDHLRASQLFQEHATYLKGEENPYALPGIATNHHDFELIDWEEATDAAKSSSNGKNTADAPVGTDLFKAPRNGRHMDDDSFARLTGEDLFGPYEPNWTDPGVTLGSHISKFSDDSDEPQRRKPGAVFRSLSKRVQGAIRRPTAPKKHAVDEAKRPLVKGPIQERVDQEAAYSKPTPKVSNSARGLWLPATTYKQPVPKGRPPAPENKYPNALKVKPSQRKKSFVPSAPLAPPPPPEPTRPERVVIVGDPDRDTQFGDFIDFAAIDAAIDDDDLRVAPLQIRKTGGEAHEDQSEDARKGRLVETPAARPTPPKMTPLWPSDVTKRRRTRVTEISSSSVEKKSEAGSSSSPTAGSSNVAAPRRAKARTRKEIFIPNEDRGNTEVMADTYVHDGRTRWVVSERSEGRIADPGVRGADEASDMMERLRVERAGRS